MEFILSKDEGLRTSGPAEGLESPAHLSDPYLMVRVSVRAFN
jgi:hypothetical protein